METKVLQCWEQDPAFSLATHWPPPAPFLHSFSEDMIVKKLRMEQLCSAQVQIALLLYLNIQSTQKEPTFLLNYL